MSEALPSCLCLLLAARIVVLAWLAFALGAWICVLNSYLSFLRYPLHILRGFSRASYRWVSGIPLLGSLFVALSMLRLYSLPWAWPIGIGLIVIDTGGIHWFIVSMLYQSFRRMDQ